MINPVKPVAKKPIFTRNQVLAVFGALVLATLTWWFLRPPLSPEQQLRRDMDGLQAGVENTSPRDVLYYVADDFKWNDTDREGFSKLLKGAFLETSKIAATRTGETYQINGDSATVSGTFNARYKRTREPKDAPMNTLNGNYTLQWQMHDGDWKIVSATDSENSLKDAAPSPEPIL